MFKKIDTQKVGIAAGGLAALALVTGGISLTIAGQDDPQRPSTQPTQNVQSLPTSNVGPLSTSKNPLNLPSWQTREWAGPTKGSLTSETSTWAQSVVADTELGSRTRSTLQSEANGFTSDPSKSKVNGKLNPLYTYWTTELFQTQSTLEVEALINPNYGGWVNTPTESATVKSTFTDTFAKHAKFPSLTGYTGQIEGAKLSLVYEKQLLGYRAFATYKIKFTSTSGSKTATLKAEFVPAPLADAESGDFRVLIDKASITFEKE